jgi:hypothetical protein
MTVLGLQLTQSFSTRSLIDAHAGVFIDMVKSHALVDEVADRAFESNIIRMPIFHLMGLLMLRNLRMDQL